LSANLGTNNLAVRIAIDVVFSGQTLRSKYEYVRVNTTN